MNPTRTTPTPSPGGAQAGPQYAIDSLYYKAGLRTDADLHTIVVTYLPNRFDRETIAYFPKPENARACVARIEEAAALTARVAELERELESSKRAARELLNAYGDMHTRSDYLPGERSRRVRAASRAMEAILST